MDRYATVEDYAAAKARIFDGCDVAVVNADDAVAALDAGLVLDLYAGAEAHLVFRLSIALDHDGRGDSLFERCQPRRDAGSFRRCLCQCGRGETRCKDEGGKGACGGHGGLLSERGTA